MAGYPELLHTVIDAAEPRRLAEFYRQLLGYRYRPGDKPSAGTGADEADWLVLTNAEGHRMIAIQQAENLEPSTWPDPAVPMQVHLDFTVADQAELVRHRLRALELGARLLLDRADDGEEPLYVFADPAGHPFCIFVH